jgi:hypothetical protein
MVGNILLFNQKTKEGEIVGVNKKRYYFHIGEWLSCSSIEAGQKVYYETVDDEARNIIIDEPLSTQYLVHLKIDVSILN